MWTLDPEILRQLLRTATSACIPLTDRIQYAGESPDEACLAFTACEREHGRPGQDCSQLPL